MSGSIPAALLDLKNLQILHLKANKLTGTIPELGQNPLISWVDLSSNQLHGTIPQSLGNSRTIEDLRLGNNRLYEPIPPGLCRNPNVNGGVTKSYGCDGVICPIGTYSDTGHAIESIGCTSCPDGETTLYLGSPMSACQQLTEEDLLSMLYEVMRGNLWPESSREHWKDPNVSVCDWAGLSCDKQGQLTSLSFPLAGLEEY